MAQIAGGARSRGHVGGIGMTQSGHLWVASAGKLFRYPASTLDRGAEGQTVDSDRTCKVEASSFVGVRGNDLWVGRFVKSGSAFAYPYQVNAFGGLNRSGPAFPVSRSRPASPTRHARTAQLREAIDATEAVG